MARPREAVGCRTLICRKADSGQLNDLATIHLVVDKRCAVSGELSGRVGLSPTPGSGSRAGRHLQRPASIANLKRNRVIWESRAKDASAYILPKGQCPPAETKLEVRT